MRKRFPLNVVGDFYVEDGCCITCGLPQVEAPGFLAELSEEVPHCYVIRQPQTPEQLDQAISAMCVTEVDCIRYGGTDPEVLKRIRQMGYDGILARVCDAFSEPDEEEAH